MKEPLQESSYPHSASCADAKPNLKRLVEEWSSDEDENISQNSHNIPTPVAKPILCVTKVSESPNEPKLYPLFHKGARPAPYPLPKKSLSPDSKEKLSKWLRPVKSKDGKTQMTLDAGQTRYGAKHCHICGLVYVIADPDDETLHMQQHNNLSKLRHLGWKDERKVGKFGGDYIIMVKCGDPSSHLQRVQTVLDLAYSELGFNGSSDLKDDEKLFLYVTDKKFVGLLLAQEIHEAYRAIPQTPGKTDFRFLLRSTIPVKALVGISRIWVHEKYRHRKIATRLADIMRMNMIYGKVVSISEMAFSSPTQAGTAFAARYAKTTSFLVYE